MSALQFDFRPRGISWKLVAEEVNSRVSKPYTTHYIREVAVGYRTNKKLYSLLSLLGVPSLVKQVRQRAV